MNEPVYKPIPGNYPEYGIFDVRTVEDVLKDLEDIEELKDENNE